MYQQFNILRDNWDRMWVLPGEDSRVNVGQVSNETDQRCCVSVLRPGRGSTPHPCWGRALSLPREGARDGSKNRNSDGLQS